MSLTEWRVDRSSEAQELLHSITVGDGSPVFLTAPPATGKTSFVRNDLAPAAASAGFEVAHINVWSDSGDLGNAVVTDLRKAYEVLTVPKNGLMRALKTPIKSLDVFDVGVELGEPPSETSPRGSCALIGHYVDMLAELAKSRDKRVLMLIDKAHELATPQGQPLCRALRAAIEKHGDQVCAVLCSSSLIATRKLTEAVDAPFDGYFIARPLSPPGQGLIDFVAEKYQQLTGREVTADDRAALWDTYLLVGCRPKAVLDVVMRAVTGFRSLLETNQEIREEASQRADRQLAGLAPLESAVMARASRSLPLMGDDATRFYCDWLGRAPTPTTLIAAISYLHECGMVELSPRGPRMWSALLADRAYEGLLKPFLDRRENPPSLSCECLAANPASDLIHVLARDGGALAAPAESGCDGPSMY